MNVYRSAALALDHLDQHKGSVKGSLAAAKVDGTPAETKRVLALIIETLKYRDVIASLLTTVPIQQLEKETFRKKATPSSANFITVLLHDLLLKGKIEASDKWAPKGAITRHQARLKAELVRLQIKAGKSSIKELGRSGSVVQARYVRWNPNAGTGKGKASKGGDKPCGECGTRKWRRDRATNGVVCEQGHPQLYVREKKEDWSLDALHAHLATRGFKLVTDAVYPVPEKTYFMDPHLPDSLLVFPASTSWWVGDRWYTSGAVILQDKASCIPAVVIMDGWDGAEGECIDATAAPGNKTSLMSALMGNTGTLHAFERSPQRYLTLTKMLATANCKNVTPTRGDFTETNPEDYASVTRILLDPSCSGSGIVNRLDYLVENEEETDKDKEGEKDRLEKLAGFQLQMILHAFKFPAVKRIVYSTCSIHPEEDERVVAAALASGKGAWRLAPRSSVLPEWERRGLPEELPEGHESVIRCMPEDKTNGFFVSCFERVEEGKEMEVEEKEESAEKGKKRVREEDDEEKDNEAEEEKEAKEKTSAQMERNRRKKKLQKKKKQTSS